MSRLDRACLKGMRDHLWQYASLIPSLLLMHVLEDGPWTNMNEDILEFARDWNILLVGNFNACNDNKQVTIFERIDEICHEYKKI